jgi:hypothetical protein
MTKEEGDKEQYLSQLILQDSSKIISSNEAEVALLKKKLEDIRYSKSCEPLNSSKLFPLFSALSTPNHQYQIIK